MNTGQLFHEEGYEFIYQQSSQDSDVEARSSFVTWAFENRSWVDLYLKFGERQSVMDAILVAIDSNIQCWKTVMDKFFFSSGLSQQVVRYQICPGHSALTGRDDGEPMKSLNETSCIVCNSPYTANTYRPLYKYIKMRYRFERMVGNQQVCEQMFTYIQNHRHQSSYTDFFSGSLFKEIVDQYGGFDQVSNDIFLAISTDGCSPYDRGEQQVWPIVALLLNLPPHLRYLTENILPLGFFPGPHPSNLQSYFVPILEEIINEFGANGASMTFYDGSVRRVRVHVLWCLGDLPVVAKLAGVVGHLGKHPCRFCNIRGTYHSGSKHHYYPSKISDGNGFLQTLHDIEHLPVRTIDGINNDIQKLVSFTGSATDKRKLQTDTGIKERTLLLNLPSIKPYVSFPVDIMHLFFNVSKDIITSWLSDYGENIFKLSKLQIKFIDEQLISIGSGVSTSNAPSPPSLSSIKTWKAIDFKHFCLDYSLLLMENVLPIQYLNGWKVFVELYELSCRPLLSEDDANDIGIKAVQFVEHVEQVYFQYNTNNLKVMKYPLHLLLHLKESVLRNGPPAYYSQFWVERFLGRVVSSLNARRNPSVSIFRSCLFHESAKIIYDLPFASSNEEYRHIDACDGYRLTGSGLKIYWNSSSVPRTIRSAMVYYFCRKWPYLSANDCNELFENIVEVIAFPRIKVLQGNEVQCIGSCADGKKLLSTKFKNHGNYFCASHMNEDLDGCDVYYGRARKYLRVVFNPDNLLVINLPEQCIQFDVVVMEWALRLTKGLQGQVRSLGTSSGAFSHLSIEDVSVIDRKISVVDHAVPSVFWLGETGSSRIRNVTSFVDQNIRTDMLLCSNSLNNDNMNLILRGFMDV